MCWKSGLLGAIVLSFVASVAHAQGSIAYGNYQGGIIPWSPGVESVYRQAAAEHCAWYNRVAYVTGGKRGYGEYISFTCLFDRRYDPAKTRRWPW